ncbi:hypothetical protein Vretifemale_109 [Volvox reticuliferus]|nr:hypothetical protein Vretifemale_109 [Volvox reticuliferus]
MSLQAASVSTVEGATSHSKRASIERPSLLPPPPSSPLPPPQLRPVPSPPRSPQPLSESVSTPQLSPTSTGSPLSHASKSAPRMSPPASLLPRLPPHPLLPAALSLLPLPAPPQPPLYRLPRELWARVAARLDKDGRDALRLCSRETRAAVDATIARLRVVYGSAVPTERAPSSAAMVELALRGMLLRGCRPRSVRLSLSDCPENDPERLEKGRVVLAAVAQLGALEELTIAGLCLGPLAHSHMQGPHPHAHPHPPGVLSSIASMVAAAVEAVRGVTWLRLAGTSTSDESLLPGLQALLPAATRLQQLELCNLDISSLALCGTSSLVHPAWQPLWEATGLRRLVLNFRDGCAGEGVAAAASSLALGMAGMTQLHSLCLGLWRDDGGCLLAAALPIIAGTLTGLSSLELRTDSPPANLLACLAADPRMRLQELALHCEHCNGGLQDMYLLRQLTALTSLTLVNALPPDWLLHATSAAAAVAGGRGGGGGANRHSAPSHLPPGLQVLRLNRPLSVSQLAALVIPPTLTRVSFGSTAEPIRMPGAATAPEEVRRQVAAAVAKLAAWGVQDLALGAAPPPPSPPPWLPPPIRPIVQPFKGIWIRELAPLQLRTLRLYDIALDASGARTLAAAVGASLEELTVDSPGASLLRLLPGLVRMPRLRQLTVSGSACEGMSAVCYSGDRRPAAADAGNSPHSGSGSAGLLMTQPSVPKLPWGQELTPQRQSAHQYYHRNNNLQQQQQQQQQQRYHHAGDVGAVGLVGCGRGFIPHQQVEEEEGEGKEEEQPRGWASWLLTLLAAGVHVRLWHNVMGPQHCYPHPPLSSHLGGNGGGDYGVGGDEDPVALTTAVEAVVATLRAMEDVGQCSGWGRLEVRFIQGSMNPTRRWGHLAWNDVA